MPLNRVPNEDMLRRSLWGTQVFRDTAITPTYKMYGNFQVTESQAIADSPEYGGTFFQDYEPVYGAWQFGGTYAQNLTYEDLAILPRYWIKGGVTGVSDANTVPGYLYTYQSTSTADDLDVASVEHGVPGLPELAEMVVINDGTISGDIDDAEAVWKFSSNLWLRKNALKADVTGAATGGSTTTLIKTGAGWTVNAFQGAYVLITSGANLNAAVQIASNTIDTLTFSNALPSAIVAAVTFSISGGFTPAIADRTRERIAVPGTKVYIDDAPGGTMGTTEQTKWISWSVTSNNNLSAKRFGGDTVYMSDKLGRGSVQVTGQIRIEFDNRAEVDKWKAQAKRKMRIEQTGTAINTSPATTKRARIDLYNIVWSDATRDVRGTNLTRTFAFKAYVDTTAGVPMTLTVLNKMAALP